MNNFLYQVVESIKEDEETLTELIKIDNKILGTNYSIKQLLGEINDLINENREDKILINEKTLIITEGYPKETLDILNRININDECILFINRYFVAINKWLINEYQNITEKNINLDIDNNYNKYLDKNIKQIIVKGEKEFVDAVKRDFYGN